MGMLSQLNMIKTSLPLIFLAACASFSTASPAGSIYCDEQLTRKQSDYCFMGPPQNASAAKEQPASNR
jgi:hypothetical protein